MNDSLLWRVRAFVYQRFVDTTFSPSVDETARWFEIEFEEAVELYRELHNRHAFYLDPETLTVRMAWPFSAIPTDFKVHANGKTYFANCAWDMLGIPAALHTDAVIEAVCTESNKLVQLEIKDGQVANVVTLSDSDGSLPPTSETLRSRRTLPQSDMLLVHFPLPFARWYDDLVFT
ncbi:MAG: organomercurial lyase [Chloroflexota bacterium]